MRNVIAGAALLMAITASAMADEACIPTTFQQHPKTTHGASGMKPAFIVIFVALGCAVVAIGSSVQAAAADRRGQCHQRCVDVFQECADQVAASHGTMVPCQRELEACQKTCR